MKRIEDGEYFGGLTGVFHYYLCRINTAVFGYQHTRGIDI